MSTPNRSLRSNFRVRLIRASLAYGTLALASSAEVLLQPSNASSVEVFGRDQLEVFGREQHDAALFVAAVDMGRSGADATFALVSSDSCAFFGYLPISTAAECLLAAAALVPASASNYHDHKFADVTDGCTTYGGAATGSPVALLFQTDTCDVQAYGQYCGSCDSFFPCLCAVPPLPEFATATQGTCAGDDDARGGGGYRPIATLDECRRAARALYPDELDALGGAAQVVRDDYADVIDGCIHNTGDHRQIFLNPPGRCDHDAYPAYCANCDATFVCLCVRETTELAVMEAAPAEGRYVRRTSGSCGDGGAPGYVAIADAEQCQEAGRGAFPHGFRSLAGQPSLTDGCTSAVDGDWRAVVYNGPGTCTSAYHCDTCSEDFPCFCVKDD